MGSTFLYVKTFIPKLSQARCASVRYPGQQHLLRGRGWLRAHRKKLPPSGELASRSDAGEGSNKNRKLSVISLFMDDGSITLLAALIILVAFSAFFSASETAFSSLNQIRLKSRAEDGDSSAARVLAMADLIQGGKCGLGCGEKGGETHQDHQRYPERHTAIVHNKGKSHSTFCFL